MSLEAIDAALDLVPGLAVLWVELRWPATAGPALLAVADLIGLARNGAADNNGSSTAHCSSIRSPRATNQEHPTTKIYFRYTP